MINWISYIKTRRTRRIILIAGGALALGFLIMTLYYEYPRQVDFSIRLPSYHLAERRSRLMVKTISSDETVIEVVSTPAEARRRRLDFQFRLGPEPHEVFFRVHGCSEYRQIFNPRQIDRLTIDYGCHGDI